MSKTNSFVLLRWLLDEKISIEPISSARKGTNVYTGVFGDFKWAGKYYEAEVLKMSGERTYTCAIGSRNPRMDNARYLWVIIAM